MNKKTIVIGASTNPQRYSYKATLKLIEHNHEVIPVGIKKGSIHEVEILHDFPKVLNVHTVAMYIGHQNQPQYYNYILNLKPKRIIFNPGTENEEFEIMAQNQDIEVVRGCVLVMLSIKLY